MFANLCKFCPLFSNLFFLHSFSFFSLLLNDLIQFCVTYLLLHRFFYSTAFSFSKSSMGYVNIPLVPLVKYLIAANLCPGECHDPFGIILSVAVGFLYKANFILFSSFAIVISKIIMLFSESYSIVNCIKVVKLLNLFKTSCILYVLER